MNSLVVLLPLAFGILLVGGGLAWPVAYRAGLEAWSRDDFDVLAETLPAPSVLVEEVAYLRALVAELESEHAVDAGHQGAHRWGSAIGAATQVRRLAALREPTQEFAAIVSASYTSGEMAVVGQPGRMYLMAHLAAAT